MTFPWLGQYDPGVPWEIEPAETSLPWLLLRAAEKSPQAPALAFAGGAITYRRLRDQAARLAQALRALGFSPGDRLAILLPNCPQLVMAYYAALHLGGVVVLNNPLLSPPEIAYQLKDSGCRYLVVLDHLWPKVEGVWGELNLSHLIVTGLADYLPRPLRWLYSLKARWQGVAGGFRPGTGRHQWRDLLKSPPLTDPPQCGLEDTAVLQYTGGTTGAPKAAVLTHRNLLANVAQINAWLHRARYGGERLVGVIPFFHAFGLTACLNWPISQGAMIIILSRFEVQGFLGMLKKYRPTMLPGVPTLFVALINHPDLPRYDLSSLWACISGSAPLPQEVRDRFEEITGCRILEGYGLTEASPVTHINPLLGERPPGSMGLPLPGTQAQVVDAETGARELPLGEVGELILRGPQIMGGYLNRPQETALVLRDGWLFTGDLARMDEKGYFYIIDRKKDLIINRGYKIYPREVEEILYQHPRVKEAVVLGVPDAYRGEVVKVVIVPQDGAPLTAEDIHQYLTPRLATYKLPKIIEFRAELPKSQVGKVLRRVLREEAGSQAAANPGGASPDA